MAVQKLGMGMLVVEFREVAVDGFGMAAIASFAGYGANSYTLALDAAAKL